MKIFPTAITCVFLVVMVMGCGGEGGSEKELSPAELAAALDEGPRAVEVLTLDPSRVPAGAALFDSRLCSDCHTLGEADMSPDLIGVHERRTLPWLKKQITDPAWMNKHDPLTMEMIEEFDLEMAGPAVSDAQAEDLLHFIIQETVKAAE